MEAGPSEGDGATRLEPRPDHDPGAALRARPGSRHRRPSATGRNGPGRPGRPGRPRFARPDPILVRLATVAVLPIVVSVAVALTRGWVPVGDSATLAIRAGDVLRGHPPLVGMLSTASVVHPGLVTSHPGPFEVYLIAVPYRAFGPAGLLVSVAAVNALAVVTAVAVAWRRGGRALATAVAALVALLCWSLGPTVIRDPLNTHVGLLPLVAALFLCWDVRLGRTRSLPALVVAGCWIGQAHVVYLPVVAVLAVATIGLLVLDPVARPARDRRRSAVAAGTLGFVLSLPMLVDQVAGSGNLGKLVRLGGSGTEGIGAGARVVLRSFGLPPAWLRTGNGPFIALEQPRPADLAVALGTFALLGALLVGARRRRDRPAQAMLELAIAGIVALALVGARMPAGGAVLAADGMLVEWPITGFAWLALGWAAYRTFQAHPPRRPLRGDRSDPPGARAPLVLGPLARVGLDVLGLAVVAALVVAAATAAPRFGGFGEGLVDPVARVEPSLRQALAGQRVVQFDAVGWAARLYARQALMADVERHGITTRTDEDDPSTRRGGPGAPEPTATVWVVSGPSNEEPPAATAFLAARVGLVPLGHRRAVIARRRRLRAAILAAGEVHLKDGPRVSADQVSTEYFHFDRPPPGGSLVLPSSWVTIEAFVDLCSQGLVASPRVDPALVRAVRRDDLGRYFASSDFVLSIWVRVDQP